MLFYTNDPAVIERGKFHSEFFDEFDLLQHQLLDDRSTTSRLCFEERAVL